jgi:sortase A
MANSPFVEPLATPGRPVLGRARRLLATPARRAVGALVALALLGASTTVVVGSASAEDRATPLAARPEIIDDPVTTTSALPAEEEATEDVPVAAPPKAGTKATAPPRPTPKTQIGEIRIAKIGLVHPIYEGVTLDVVDHGPGHWPGSAVPGQLGNAVFAGHRVTHSHPFRNLDQMAPGDEIVFSTRHGEFTYRMTSLEIVSNKDTWIVKPTPEATLTLFACHPLGSAKQRIVVRGILTSSLAA